MLSSDNIMSDINIGFCAEVCRESDIRANKTVVKSFVDFAVFRFRFYPFYSAVRYESWWIFTTRINETKRRDHEETTHDFNVNLYTMCFIVIREQWKRQTLHRNLRNNISFDIYS